METTTILTIIQVVISVVLIGLILVQNKGTGLSSSFGGEGNVYSTKRGAEKSVFMATIVCAALFVGLSIAHLFIQ
ncbi:preprotein translocase subunit SecG [Patescibacteria group bacterium]|nr:preprotein translocase subunit SecG [Patescibacteria group bacterium]